MGRGNLGVVARGTERDPVGGFHSGHCPSATETPWLWVVPTLVWRGRVRWFEKREPGRIMPMNGLKKLS